MHISVVLDCVDPAAIAPFWIDALGYEVVADDDPYVALRDPERQRPTLLLQRVAEPKTVKNRMHLDLFSEAFEADRDRLLSAGATVVTPEHRETDGMRIVVLADPAGNEFCLLEHPDAAPT